ncbi:hypothetical protein R3P38DRAFT_2866522, partial [Favolaschia claudopus]
ATYLFPENHPLPPRLSPQACRSRSRWCRTAHTGKIPVQNGEDECVEGSKEAVDGEETRERRGGYFMTVMRVREARNHTRRLLFNRRCFAVRPLSVPVLLCSPLLVTRAPVGVMPSPCLPSTPLHSFVHGTPLYSERDSPSTPFHPAVVSSSPKHRDHAAPIRLGHTPTGVSVCTARRSSEGDGAAAASFVQASWWGDGERV